MARGHAPSLEQLCADSPDLVDELRRRITDLGEINALLENGDRPADDWPYTVAGVAVSAPAISPAVSPYVDLQFHARGNLGEVFRAHDERLNRVVALKIIQSVRAGTPAYRRRFERESEITGAWNTPESRLSMPQAAAMMDARIM